MLHTYFKGLYHRTMTEAYSFAYEEIAKNIGENGLCLDCGASDGYLYKYFNEKIHLTKTQYTGIEWNTELVNLAQRDDIRVTQGDLNKNLPYENKKFDVIFGLSVLEHLLYPCRFIKECQRVLNDDGTLILLTPNISTYFTAILILLGKMPSSGPHPDSDLLLKNEEVFKVSSDNLQTDAESDTPSHRHLVVFSYRVLRSYLEQAGFRDIKGYGFGLYPFPNFMQPLLQKIDPYHCHQMVFVAKK